VATTAVTTSISTVSTTASTTLSLASQIPLRELIIVHSAVVFKWFRVKFYLPNNNYGN
jgi:hypothetical protein